MQTEMIDFDIQMELANLYTAIQACTALDNTSANAEQKDDADYNIHLTARSLYSRYHNAETWSKTNPLTRRTVRSALAEAFVCVTENTLHAESVQRQCDAFDTLAKERGLAMA